MDAAKAIAGQRAILASGFAPAGIWRVASVGLTILLAASAVLLVERRLVGALAEALPAIEMVGLILLAGAMALAVGFLSQQWCDDAGRVAIELSIASVSLPVLAFAISIAGSSPAALTAVWVFVVGVEGAMWNLQRRRAGAVESARVWRQKIVTPRAPEVAAEIGGGTQARDALQVQAINYRRGVDGNLAVEGWMRIEFAAEERTANAHVAFCPAFNRRPVVESEIIEGEMCEVRPTLVLPWGVRWEVRLEKPVGAGSVVVLGFLAVEGERLPKSS